MNYLNNFVIPKIIGHRGVKNLSPENTIESIQKAINLGLRWVEIDVKISKDKIPYLLHDDNFERTTNGFGEASKLNYSKIKKLDAGIFFYNKKTEIYPPTLQEVLKLCKKNQCGINIELKPNKGFEKQNVKEVLNVTKKFGKNLPIFFSSFDFSSCIFLKEINSKLPCGLLIDDFEKITKKELYKTILQYNFFSLGINIKLVNKNFVNELKNKNLFLTVFSEKNINKEQAKDLWDLGVDSIFSDDPTNLLS